MRLQVSRQDRLTLQNNICDAFYFISAGSYRLGLSRLLHYDRTKECVMFHLLAMQIYLLWGKKAKESKRTDKKYPKERKEKEPSYENCWSNAEMEYLNFNKRFLCFRITISSEQRNMQNTYKHFVTVYFLGFVVFSTFWRTGNIEGYKYEKDYAPFYDLRLQRRRDKEVQRKEVSANGTTT